LTLLFSPEGACLLPDGEEFLSALGDPNPDYDAVGFAVRNVGFIKFQVLDRLVTEIELHPRNVDRDVLLAVERQLRKSGTKLFRIKYLDSEWHSEISASAEHTIARLHELCAPATEPNASERFRVEPQDHALLMRDADNPLRLLIQKWRTSFGNFDSSVIGLAFSSNLLPLMVIVGFDKPEAGPIFRFIGDGHVWAGRRFQINGIGEKVENIPDREYGHWVSEIQRSVASSGQPRYDVVTADMRLVDEDGRPKSTRRYERLLLPWRAPSGEVFITSCARSGARAGSVSGAGDSACAKKASRSAYNSSRDV
jgi:hypothetical protein